jgi:hypothetical protein
LKKARKAKLLAEEGVSKRKFAKTALARELFELASSAQLRGWSAEELLAGEIKKQEQQLRRREQAESSKIRR